MKVNNGDSRRTAMETGLQLRYTNWRAPSNAQSKEFMRRARQVAAFLRLPPVNMRQLSASFESAVFVFDRASAAPVILKTFANEAAYSAELMFGRLLQGNGVPRVLETFGDSLSIVYDYAGDRIQKAEEIEFDVYHLIGRLHGRASYRLEGIDLPKQMRSAALDCVVKHIEAASITAPRIAILDHSLENYALGNDGVVRVDLQSASLAIPFLVDLLLAQTMFSKDFHFKNASLSSYCAGVNTEWPGCTLHPRALRALLLLVLHELSL